MSFSKTMFTLARAAQEIVDETDQYIDNMRLQRVNAALLTSTLPKHLRKCASQRPLSHQAVHLQSSAQQYAIRLDDHGVCGEVCTVMRLT